MVDVIKLNIGLALCWHVEYFVLRGGFCDSLRDAIRHTHTQNLLALLLYSCFLGDPLKGSR